MSRYICDGCGKSISKGQRYCLRAQLFAAPEVEIDAQDMLRDIRKEMAELCRRAQEMDAKKLEEDVYICYDLSLCKCCRDVFSQRIKCKEFI